MDVVGQYGWLTCECQEDNKRPKRRVIKGGRTVYGYECQNCGRFEQKSMKSFGWSLPGDFVDESIAKSFQERQQTFLDNKKEDSKKKWRDFYDSYIQSDAWRKKKRCCFKERQLHLPGLPKEQGGSRAPPDLRSHWQ